MRWLTRGALVLRFARSNGEVFVPQEGVFSCAWFFCPSAAGERGARAAAHCSARPLGRFLLPLTLCACAAADAAGKLLREALLLERLPLLRGAKVRPSRGYAPRSIRRWTLEGNDSRFSRHARR